MAERPGLLEMLGQTWPARMAKSAWEAAKLPGDVYAGRTDPLSDEGIGRAADLGGMVMGGTYAGAPRGAMGAGAVKPIRAYHGSPHDFDRFDLSKIGTGEGAQAYGHGLYFAENQDVARSYRDALSRGNDPRDYISEVINSLRGKIPGDISKDTIALELRKYDPTKSVVGNDAAMTDIHRAANAYDIKTDTYSPEGMKALQRLNVTLPEPNPGRMYEVNINADPAHMLDWDKALNQQGPEVTAALQQAMRPRQWQEFSPAQAGTAMKQGFIGLDERIASEKLRDAGLPGIKYLDQGSRGAKEGTSNYVLFRDDIIDIVKKYGLAGAAAMYGISQDEAKAAMDDKPKTHIGNKTYENK